MARTVTLIGADGGRHTLACGDGPLWLGTGSTLWGDTSYSFSSTRVADIAGERLDDAHPSPRLIGLPIRVIASTPTELETELRALGATLAPDRPVRVQFTRDDGGTREIVAHCVDGQDQLTVAAYDETATEARLVLRAFDPFWRSTDADQSLVSETFLDAQQGLENPVDIVNGSDVPAVWPEFVINGPIEKVQIGSHETGRVTIVHAILTVSDSIRIVTDPARRDVWVNGERDWFVLSNRSQFWPLVPGLNRVVVRGFDAGNSPGSFEIRWAERFRTC